MLINKVINPETQNKQHPLQYVHANIFYPYMMITCMHTINSCQNTSCQYSSTNPTTCRFTQHKIIIIMCIYHAFINALSTHMIHININMIFYTHVEYSPTKTIYIKYYMEKQTDTHTTHTLRTHTHTHTHTHTPKN